MEKQENHPQPLSEREIEALQKELILLKEEIRLLKTQRLLKSKQQEVEKLLSSAQRLRNFKNKIKKAVETLPVTDEIKQKFISELKKEKFDVIDWNDLHDRFDMSFPGFLNVFKRKFPELSTNDLRLIMLTKMELNTREVSSILGVSEKSVETSKYRLRNKLSLPKGDKLTRVINSIGNEAMQG